MKRASTRSLIPNSSLPKLFSSKANLTRPDIEDKYFFPGSVFVDCVEEACHVFFWIPELSQRSDRGRR